MYGRCESPVFTEPGARPGTRFRCRSATPRGAAERGPRMPCAIERNQVLAKRRMEELQRIFTSDCAEEVQQHRERLLALEQEAEALRRRIVDLEEQQRTAFQNNKRAYEESAAAEITKSRMQSLEQEKASASDSEPEEPPAPHAHMHSAHHEKPAPVTAHAPRLKPDSSTELSPPSRELGHRATAKRVGLSMTVEDQKGHAMALVQKLEETAKQQESLIEDMNAELKDLIMQTSKQNNWVAKLEGEVLDTEITKVRYRVRLSTADARNAELSDCLKGSYDKMAQLLKERVASEEESAKNDAILLYLQEVFKANTEQAKDFVYNRGALRGLTERCKLNRDLRQQVQELAAQLNQEGEIAEQIIHKTEDLQKKLDTVQNCWMTIPAEVKSSVHLQEDAAAFKAKRAAIHPLNALRTIRDHLQYINSKQHSVQQNCRRLQEVAPVLDPHDMPGTNSGGDEGEFTMEM